MIRPIREKVLVKQESTSSGSIAMVSLDDFDRGRVVDVGEGFLTNAGAPTPLVVKVGDLVLYSNKSGQKVRDGGERYVLLRESEIWGVVTASEQGETHG